MVFVLGGGLWTAPSGSDAEAQIFPEPLVVACGDGSRPPDFIPEIRIAASLAAGIQLSKELKGEFQPLLDLLADEEDVPPDRRRPIPHETLKGFETQLSARIAELERLARGPNRPCREIAEPNSIRNLMLRSVIDVGTDLQAGIFLGDLYLLRAVVRALLTLDVPEVTPATLDEAFPGTAFFEEVQRLVRSVAEAGTFELGLSRATVTILPILLLGADDLPIEVILDEMLDDVKWERVACGGIEAFPGLGLELDGSLLIADNDQQGFPFRQYAAISWFFAVFLQNPLAALFDPASFLERLLEQAASGCSPELRTVAAEIFFAFVGDRAANALAPEIARVGESPELRAAAAWRFALQLADDPALSIEDLQRLALTEETPELQSAAGLALGLRWYQQARDGSLGFATALSFLGPDGRTRMEGNLMQLAAAHTSVHPELAQAAVLPLTALFIAEAP